ncbi:MAG: histidinol-phosphate phosphatase family protein [Candidatus Binatus sp.]|nr:histidinol-phosphate phosphatase family protein [Candidatus Binatus sp.]
MDLGGTLVALNETRSLPLDPEGNVIVQLLPNVREKLNPIRDHLMFVVTNQAGIGRGWFGESAVEAALQELDRQLGDILTAWKVCPHVDDDRCACRKPKGGMILELAELYGVDLGASTMVGDQEVDRSAGEAAGVGKFVFADQFFGWK